jgi:hypothetical protein
MFVVRLYIFLILLGLIAAVAGAYLGNTLLLTSGAAWAVFWFSLEVGLIIHEYQGMARLMAVHDKLIVASIKAQGFELEGMASLEEEEGT